MKKLLAFLCAVGVIVCFSYPAWAGGIDNKTNWSVEYVRTFNRNAATDAADIALYNPAGTVKMDNGLYANLSAHYIKKDYNNRIAGGDRESDEPSIIPGLFMVYKLDQWAFFGAISNHGGGGFVDFTKGNQSTNKYAYARVPAAFPTGNESLKAESYYIGYTAGAAYKINKVWAVSLAGRFIEADKEADGHVTYSDGFTENFDYSYSANGWGGIIGLNISPGDKWNIGLRYESKVELEFKYKVNRDSLGLLAANGITSGTVKQRDLPAIFGAGVSYQFTPKLRAETNLTWYFNSDADWEGSENNVDDSYDVGIMVEYKFNDRWLGTIGYLYTESGISDPQYMTPEAPELDAHTIGGGVAWKPWTNWTLNFAVGNAFYVSDSFTYTTGQKIEYEKNNFFVGFGFEYKFK